MSLTNLAATLSQELSYFPQKTNIKFKIVPNLPFPEIQIGGCIVPIKANDWVEDGYYYSRYRYKDFGVWFNHDGSETIIFVRKGYDPESVSKSMNLVLCSIIAGVDLGFQNRIAIHGNAVSIQGLAVAFVGARRKGKSTLSSYCASQGAEFISDDVLLLDADGLLYPGCPKIRLGSRTINRLGLGASQNQEQNKHQVIPLLKQKMAPIPIPNKRKFKSFLIIKKLIKKINKKLIKKKKRYKSLCDPYSLGIKINNKPTRCGIIYFPEESSDGSIYSEELHTGRALFKLIDHSYYAKDLIPSNPDLFHKYLHLSKQISVRKLFYPRDYSMLPQVYEFITEEINQLQLN